MIRALLRNAGIHPGRIAAALRGWPRYARERNAYREADTDHGFPMGRELPMLTEWEEASGSLGAYFFQDQLVARWILEADPERHVDIGSRLDGFIGSLSVFREVDVIDIRPGPAMVHNVRFHQLDLMGELPGEWVGCTDSLSCLHTIEHFGLGRYGDPIDPKGHLKGISQLKGMVKPGGMLYLSTQIGPQRVEFNAHRVFAPETVLAWFGDGWELVKCGVIDEQCGVHEDTTVDTLRNFSGNLGVGIVAGKKLG